MERGNYPWQVKDTVVNFLHISFVGINKLGSHFLRSTYEGGVFFFFLHIFITRYEIYNYKYLVLEKFFTNYNLMVT